MVDLVKLKGVSVVLDRRAIQAVLVDQQGPVARDMRARAERVVALARQLVGVDTGRLRAAIRARPMTTVGGAPAYRVDTSNVPYARWHHDGTGLYGPRRQVIRPVRAKALRFTPKGGNRPIFRAWVRGQRGTFFLTRALEAAADPGQWAGQLGPGPAARGPAWAGGITAGPTARPAWAGNLTAGPAARPWQSRLSAGPRARTTTSSTRRRRNPFRRRRRT